MLFEQQITGGRLMKWKYCVIYVFFSMAFMSSCLQAIAPNVKNKSEYFFGTTNAKLSDPTDITSATHSLSVPTENYMIKEERGNEWIQGIQGIVFTSVPWSHETSFYVPSTVRRNSAIASGKFIEYIGSERWRWSIKETKETEVGKGGLRHREKDPSFIVTISFQPYRPEPLSIISSRNNANMRSRNCWWLPPLYISPAQIDLMSGYEKENINTPLGIFESYKFRFENGTISPNVFDKTLLISNQIESTLWYDANTGLLLKEETKTAKGEVYKFTISKTNINLSI